jgi:hypothetical protein
MSRDEYSLPGYDAWKLMSPDDERDRGEARSRKIMKKLREAIEEFEPKEGE